MTLTAHAAHAKDKRTAENGPELQHRHFAFIAGVLKARKPPQSICERHEWDMMVQAFANACAASNSRFDRYRFLRACGAIEG